ncbi:unnamed protein product (macronuclear) [Paramecium tetraurelia]|uniref:Uncharacterized protein n=1 Tax=Paramecium tetraurelia TaxID=5888 RepID=A0E5Q0_PARTE|nr:uncharacterized protein GSPATT00003479001 [Paramecium tetraurelia]CAK90617.1 unnamed protein product [Paramecium tetraurelia]|eukprot:XP_001458014.1 hypothetical protein (macronuclear) [Paramecium tetraurelia strain d4-2]
MKLLILAIPLLLFNSGRLTADIYVESLCTYCNAITTSDIEKMRYVVDGNGYLLFNTERPLKIVFSKHQELQSQKFQKHELSIASKILFKNLTRIIHLFKLHLKANNIFLIMQIMSSIVQILLMENCYIQLLLMKLIIQFLNIQEFPGQQPIVNILRKLAMRLLIICLDGHLKIMMEKNCCLLNLTRMIQQLIQIITQIKLSLVQPVINIIHSYAII